MRDASTYRSERRNEWRAAHFFTENSGLGKVSWAEFNQPPHDERGIYGTPISVGLLRRPARSKYKPHNGKREMARRVEQMRLKAADLTRHIAARWLARHAPHDA